MTLLIYLFLTTKNLFYDFPPLDLMLLKHFLKSLNSFFYTTCLLKLLHPLITKIPFHSTVPSDTISQCQTEGSSCFRLSGRLTTDKGTISIRMLDLGIT